MIRTQTRSSFLNNLTEAASSCSDAGYARVTVQHFVDTTGRYVQAHGFAKYLQPGDQPRISLHPSRSGFHLPQDDKSPLIMACAETSLALINGYVAERALKKNSGADVGPVWLFYGLCAPDENNMYRDLFDAWEEQGVVSVQDRIWHDREDVRKLFRKGANLYLSGAGVVGTGVEGAIAEIRAEVSNESLEEATEWVRKMKGKRFRADVFA